jgi:hypothetical protein
LRDSKGPAFMPGISYQVSVIRKRSRIAGTLSDY